MYRCSTFKIVTYCVEKWSGEACEITHEPSYSKAGPPPYRSHRQTSGFLCCPEGVSFAGLRRTLMETIKLEAVYFAHYYFCAPSYSRAQGCGYIRRPIGNASSIFVRPRLRYTRRDGFLLSVKPHGKAYPPSLSWIDCFSGCKNEDRESA